MFQPGPENVASCVDIPVVGRSAFATFPVPHSKPRDTSRPRRRQRAALRTGLGSPAFVNINIHRMPSGSLVTQHISKIAPTGVEHGLCHASFCQLKRTNVADRNKSVLSGNLGRLLVEVVASRVGDLRVNCADTLYVSGLLGNCQLGLVLPVMPECGDNLAGAESGEFFQAKIYTDFARTLRQVIRHFAGKGGIPSTSGVLNERAGFEATFDVPTLPEAKAASQVNGSIAFDLGCSGDVWNPSKRTLGPKAAAKPRALSVLVPALDKAAANHCHCIRMDAEAVRTAFGQSVEIEDVWVLSAFVSAPSTFSLTLSGDAKVPYLIAGNGIAAKLALTALDTKLEADNAQSGPVLSQSGLVKSASSGASPLARSTLYRGHDLKTRPCKNGA